MNDDDIKEAVAPLGLRIEFRQKLYQWRNSQSGDKKQFSEKPTDVVSAVSSCRKAVLIKSLHSLLNETQKGKDILEYEETHRILSQTLRDDLIAIIVEEAIFGNIAIKVPDFQTLLDEICLLFPSQISVKKYYFIPRKGRGNPSEKLYSKYSNRRSQKKKKMERKSLEMVVSGADDEDSSICKAYKLTLSRTCDDWDSVRDMWKKTFNLRQQDVTTLNNLKFFEAWNKFSHAKAFELIDIDFEIMYPGKGFHLLSKWQEFRDKIFGYYEDNISNAQ
ncbi:uncharacterized protein [Drosophila takahashii]|uniref:uncharacterized protein n=1 Tax=Drosophila takahashii TaxID=29030 RepID=UPI0038991479